MQFKDAINIVALLFYSQKKKEEKLNLKKKCAGGDTKSCDGLMDRQAKKKFQMKSIDLNILIMTNYRNN
jgi:hypothetical protein